MTLPIKVLIADSQFLVREGLKALLSQFETISLVGECSDAQTMFAMMQEAHPDVVIVDYNSKGNFSFNDIQLLQKEPYESKVLVITTDQNKESIYKTLGTGVNGFLFKECDADEVINAIYACHKGERFICNRVLDLAFDQKKNALAMENCDPTTLSEREMEILSLVGEGLTTAAIAEKLCLSSHTISTHRKNIIRKLGVNSTGELVAFAAGLMARQE